MKVVHKYPISFVDSEVKMPKGADVLHADTVNGLVFIWAMVNPKHKLTSRYFKLFATGEAIEDYDKKHYHYIKTLLNNGFVFHLYEIIE